mgnify:FL=1|jgi:uncharacterized membrane protein YgaE (UPF0421/DUF939 family)|tara:strand:- start:53 stop:271 length:219 start_codon:yes stop_codon:yes gene_type:complete
MASSMSYCAAENTNDLVEQLIDIIEDGGKNDVFSEEGNNYEADAIHALAENGKYLSRLCEELIDKAEEEYGD